MKQLIGVDLGSYTFNKTAKTVTLSGINTIPLEQVLLITNVTSNVVIYQFNNPALGGSIASNVITLDYDTSAMDNSDRLQIFIEYDSLGQTTAANSSPVVLASDQVLPSVTSTKPTASTSALPVRPVPAQLFRCTFARVISSPGVDTEFFTLLQTGSGMAVSQSAGNLVITSGTTANSETVLRSTSSFTNELIAKWQATLSQRIANNNFVVELVDVIGDALALTVNSATSITVTIPSNPFTSQNVGQGMYVGVISGVANAVPQRAVIASVSGNNVTFTVAGFPVSGSGTCSLFGWNYHQVIYSGVTATNMTYDAQRRGWNSGATTLTINTTAAPGHLGILQSGDGVASVLDQLVASATAIPTTMRGSRVVNLPEENTALFLQIRALNGTSAPASTTTWTIGTVSVENFASQAVAVTNTKSQPFNTPQPVQVVNTPATTVTGTLTTVTTVAAVTAANLALPGTIADVASAALTTTTTTAAFTPTFGVGYSIVIPVTVVTGTTPTLDVAVEESDDSGTNWYKVYDFPRITATGIYRSPILQLKGNRVRYVQTVAGTTPSFTRAVNRLQISEPAPRYVQLVDRSIVLNTLNSVTPALYCEGCVDFNMSIRVTSQSAAATVAVQFSDDGTNWFTTASTIVTAVGILQAKLTNETWKFVRATVTAQGTSVVFDYVSIKGVGR